MCLFTIRRRTGNLFSPLNNNEIANNTRDATVDINYSGMFISKVEFQFYDLDAAGTYTIAEFKGSIPCPIDAVDDTYNNVTPGSTTASVIVNDTFNGSAATIGTTAGTVSIQTTNSAGTAATWPAGFTLNADGTITLGAGVTAGTHTLYYKICAQTANTLCDVAMVTITVPIAAVICSEPTTYNYQTIANGAWNATSTWQGGNVPTGSNQNILITHNITYSGNLQPASGTTLVIKSGATLSVSQNLELKSSNTKLIVKDAFLNVGQNFILDSSGSSICAINSCFDITENLELITSNNVYLENTGIRVRIGNLDSSANVTGSNIKLWVMQNMNRNGGTWAGSTITQWYAGGNMTGFTGLPTESASTFVPCSPNVCYERPTDLATLKPVKHGISVLGRAGKTGVNGNVNDWPMVRNSAYTALEGKTKGFVITRIANPETAITDPKIGMMVFDTDADAGKGCLKINTTGTSTGWKCFTKQSCP